MTAPAASPPSPLAPQDRPQSHYGNQFGPSGAQTRVNASTFQVYKTCPRKYYYYMLLGNKKSPDSPDLRFGTLIHAAKALYELNRARGATHEIALQGSFRWLLHETWNFELNKPAFTEDPLKNRATLLRTFVAFVDRYNLTETDPCETVVLPSGRVAVEVPFEFDSGYVNPWDEQVTFVGVLDRIVTFNGKRYISDIKTSKSGWWLTAANYSPDGQFSLYPIAGLVCFGVETEGVILDGIELGPNGAKFHRVQVPRPTAVLEEWLEDSRVHLRRMGESFAREEWPQNDATCGLYGGCPFRRVCAAAPADRAAILQLDPPTKDLSDDA